MNFCPLLKRKHEGGVGVDGEKSRMNTLELFSKKKKLERKLLFLCNMLPVYEEEAIQFFTHNLQFSTKKILDRQAFNSSLFGDLRATTLHCLKMTEKVSFNMASEASYVYIFSIQKFNKCQKWPVFLAFENLKDKN